MATVPKLADDVEAIETLQEWCGYCLTTDTRQQKIFLVVGPKRSGKGTIARVLTKTARATECLHPLHDHDQRIAPDR
jgi:putative DNA primase/helicase